jgi:hypothetical protein
VEFGPTKEELAGEAKPDVQNKAAIALVALVAGLAGVFGTSYMIGGQSGNTSWKY